MYLNLIKLNEFSLYCNKLVNGFKIGDANEKYLISGSD